MLPRCAIQASGIVPLTLVCDEKSIRKVIMHIGIASPLDTNLLRNLVDIPKHIQCTAVVPYISLLIEEIVRQGHEVSVYTFSFDVDKTKVYMGSGLKLYISPMRKRVRELGLSFYRTERLIMKEVIEGDDPEIVHAHWTYEYALAVTSTHKTHVVTAHDAPWGVLRYQMDPLRVIKLLMAYRVSFSAQHMTAVSPFTEKQWKTLMLYRGTIDIIGNGLPDKMFSNPASSERDIQSDKVHEFVLASINVGWGRRKNSRSLIQAFGEVKSIFPSASLLLFGADHGEGELAHKWAKENSLEKGIKFLGVKKHDFIMEALKRDVDLYVHPARQEQCALAILEAMSVGVPVIGGKNSGGVPWQLGYGEYGVLVDVNSPSAISEKIIEILKDKKSLQHLSIQAYNGCKEHFSIENVAKKYVSVYREILST